MPGLPQNAHWRILQDQLIDTLPTILTEALRTGQTRTLTQEEIAIFAENINAITRPIIEELRAAQVQSYARCRHLLVD
jgi:hypothetical protein